MIKKTKSGKFQLISKTTGKPLTKPTTKKAVEKREKQINYFKYLENKKKK